MSAEIEAIDALVIIGTLVVVWGAIAALFVSQNRGIVSAPRVSLRGCPVPRMDGQS